MSRVFVSCAYRDRALGRRIVDLVRGMGHEAADDRGEVREPDWWYEVVQRIQDSDVFVAVASPAYGAAKACRLAAKCAAASDIRVLRLDLGDEVPGNCHPVVVHAESMSFDPDDPCSLRLLTDALADRPQAPPEPVAAPPVVAERVAGPTVAAEPTPRTWLKVTAGVVSIAVSVALVAIAVRTAMAVDPSEPLDVAAGSPTASAPTATETAGGATDAALLAALGGAAERFPDFGLPLSSCRAGDDDGAITCRNPAPHIQTAVLESYPDLSALYSGYAEKVAELAGPPLPENTGNCSFDGSEGELGWNLDGRHTRDYSVTQHVAGGLDRTTQAAGRIFCTSSGELMRLVWTQDPGLLVTVTGQPPDDVIGWWSDVHMQMACIAGASGRGCQDATTS